MQYDCDELDVAELDRWLTDSCDELDLFDLEDKQQDDMATDQVI